jgi:hypothetical protein
MATTTKTIKEIAISTAFRGLCSTCNDADTCVMRKAAGDVMYCDMFDDPSATTPSAWRPRWKCRITATARRKAFAATAKATAVAPMKLPAASGIASSTSKPNPCTRAQCPTPTWRYISGTRRYTRYA